MKKNSKLILKGNTFILQDDDYETPKYILEMLLPYIEKYKIIYDPFYCNGRVKEHWSDLGKICINDKLDAFNREEPDNYDIIISNIPFTLKKQCFDLCFKLGKPFILILTTDSIGTVWIKKYFEKLQFIVPAKRLCYEKNNIQTKSCWFDTMFFCYNINLDKDIIKL